MIVGVEVGIIVKKLLDCWIVWQDRPVNAIVEVALSTLLAVPTSTGVDAKSNLSRSMGECTDLVHFWRALHPSMHGAKSMLQKS